MNQLNRTLPLLFLLLGMLACRLSPGATTPEVTQTPTPFVEVPTATAAGATATPTGLPANTGPCQIVSADHGVMAYTRPSLLADIFGQLSGAGLPIVVMAQTSDGWLGFDPGVAQAANIGVFRNRWVQASQVQVEGACESVPVVVGPPPGVCFTMPMDLTPVYDSPDPGATILITLNVGQYAAVTGTTSSGWARVDLGPGNSGSSQIGWVAAGTLNFNGPCENLPLISP